MAYPVKSMDDAGQRHHRQPHPLRTLWQQHTHTHTHPKIKPQTAIFLVVILQLSIVILIVGAADDDSELSAMVVAYDT